ncbi:MAG: Fic family protein [Acidobacteriota bacterium]|nr:Fic family protein [Acidobacteriota bacterium]
MADFTRIDALAAELRTLRPLNAGELARLREDFVIENTYNSNAIEGNSLTLRETALILKEGLTIGEKPIKDHLEAIGHRDAFEYVISLADADTPLTERVVKDIHSLVLMNDRNNKGVYRGIPVYISGALHEPPQPYLVPVQMATLIANYDAIKSDRHIIEAVSEFHLRFEGVHPFIDGNGRTGRLILNLELIKAGLLPVNIKYTDRRKYYDCFDAYHGEAHTPDTLSHLIAEYEAEELERYIGIVKGAGKY